MKVLQIMARDVLMAIVSPFIVIAAGAALVLVSPVLWYFSAKERVFR